MAVYFKINTVDWAGKISDIAPIIKDSKPTATSIQGETRTLLSRSLVGTSSIKLVFPYLDWRDMSALQSLAANDTQVAIDHNLDVPGGQMKVTEFAKTVVKVLSGVLYRVEMTFTSVDTSIVADLNPQEPVVVYDPGSSVWGL